MFTKRIWQSKTFWLNIIGLLLAILELFDVGVLTILGFKDPIKAAAIVAATQSVLNVILRWGNPAPIVNDKAVPSGTHIDNVADMKLKKDQDF